MREDGCTGAARERGRPPRPAGAPRFGIGGEGGDLREHSQGDRNGQRDPETCHSPQQNPFCRILFLP